MREMGQHLQLEIDRPAIRRILKQHPARRKEEEVDKVVAMLAHVDFFKNAKLLTAGELRELAQSMTCEEVEADEIVTEYGDKADKFYVILQGMVGVSIRNEVIDRWDWALMVYHHLEDWKVKEFDKKVEKEMK